jgi:thiol-disulfide isomerase/thioredoxin
MKQLLVVFLIVLPLTRTIGQSPSRAMELTNSIAGLVQKGNIDQAVKSTVELAGLSAPLLDFPINKILAISLIEENRKDNPKMAKNSIRYFRDLSDARNSIVDAMIWPLVSWLNISESSSKKDKIRQVKTYLDRLPKDSLDWGMADLYILLILKDLDKNEVYNNPACIDLFNRLQSHLLIQHQKNPNNDRNSYLLSYSWYYLSQKDPNRTDDFLSKAAESSPELNTSNYFYEMLMLDYTLQREGFRKEYYDYLVGKGRESQALPVMEKIAQREPIDQNINELKRLFQKVNPDKSNDFPQYWYQVVTSFCNALPATSFKNDLGEEISIWTKTGKWTYIDVWGTWCSPCVAELPDLQELYTKNLKTPETPLAIVTWGFDSQAKIDTFMKDKGYTFPVILITKNFTKTFNITGYPTKMLITPDGKYLKIPFNTDWKQYLRNYIGMQ